ncbi:MAG: sugar phosphate isomerase/epimerase, partial [Spirochaetales bacterium]|nr:sugar phosphate isomerase/epimerase [Spirochaetales bacterium]
MKGFGIFAWFGYRLSVEKRITAMKEAGFQATSIWIDNRARIGHRWRESNVVSTIRSHGLDIENAHGAYFRCNKIWSEFPGERRIIQSEYEYYLDYCNSHQIPMLVLHVTKGIKPPKFNEAGLDLIRDLVEYGQKRGVSIALENTRYPDYIDFLLGNIDSPYVGLCYDSSHDFLYSKQPGALLGRWGDRLFCTHLSDNDGAQDRHWLPFSGSGNWEAVLNAFPNETYKGYLSLEVLPKRKDSFTAGEFLEEALQTLNCIKDRITSGSLS